MKQILLFLCTLLCIYGIKAQEDAWVYLIEKDTETVNASIANPIDILTQKAIDRKHTHNIVIDARDVPVNETYIAQLKAATGITVMAKSKWFNAVHIRGSVNDINALTNLDYVDYIEFANKNLNNKKAKEKLQAKFNTTLANYNYGSTVNQVEMIGVNHLHTSGFTGTGITIAVLDAGFPSVNTMGGFQHLVNSGKIMGTYNFVNRNNDVYTNTTSNHGTLVLSTMAGYIENQYVGTAPDASYYLFITEDDMDENPVEESYWVEAAERADSLGVDIINTSLGYKAYLNPNYSYNDSNLDGYTTYITKGANHAFEKGLLLVNSAGNDSNSIVDAPSDSPNVLSIGAVNASGSYAGSSVGSNIQPTQKPDVMAQGQGTSVITENNTIATSNGTSFSSPIMAGGIACLWQALPNKSNTEIMQIVRKSASQYTNPDYQYGYGIPNLWLAYNNNTLPVETNTENKNISIYPNPVLNHLYIKQTTNKPLQITVFNGIGKLVFQQSHSGQQDPINVSYLSSGLYMIRIQSEFTTKTIKFLKQ
ncbi:MAG: S8 family serine peptidase [Aestuariibaculum sp.]